MESMHRMMKIQRLQESRAQVVRSVGRWSAGTKTESSTHQAYCDLIQDSKHFIYIENQFFCSGLEGTFGKCWEGHGRSRKMLDWYGFLMLMYVHLFLFMSCQ